VTSGPASLDTGARRARLRELARDRGLDAIVVYGNNGYASHLRYFAGYAPHGGNALVVVAPDHDLLVVPYAWDIDRGRTLSGIEAVVSGSPVTAALGRLGRVPGRLGLVGLDVMPYPLVMSLQSSWTDLTEEVLRFRRRKGTDEQDALRRAAHATDAGFEAIRQTLAVGRTGRELAAIAEAAMKRAGADGVGFEPMVTTGPETQAMVGAVTGRPVERGDLVIADLGAASVGYSADLTRTFVVGAPSEEQRRMFAAVREAFERAVNAVRPGAPANSVHLAARMALDAAGYGRYWSVRIGHGIGLETSLEWPDLELERAPLEPGMAFCIEPGVYIPGIGGLRLEDDVIVTATAAELLSRTPRELITVG
jgi:Xaa-Pro aminopeptidase